MTRIGKIIALIAVLCVSTELIGAFLYFLETGKVVYLTHEYLAREPDRAGELVMQAKGKPRLHPYFGFSRQFETDLKSPTNNYVGFRQRERLENPGSPGPNDF